MNKLLTAVILILLILLIGHMVVISNNPLRDKLLSNPKLSEIINRMDELHLRIKEVPERLQSGEAPLPLKRPSAPQKPKPEEMVALYFKDGSVMEGKLLEETKNEYAIEWEDQRFVVYADQIKRIERGIELSRSKDLLTDDEITKGWPYQNDIAIRLTNRVVLDAEITRAGKDKLTLLYPAEGGGRIEQDIERSKVEYLIFKPVDNKESRTTEKTLKELFPEMKFYQEGNFTLVTDSYITWVREYRKTLREAYTNLYLEFFDLFKDRKPKIQNFVVIFDDYIDFIIYALADGVPGFWVAGYFSPTDEVLYLFNVLGDKFSEFLFEAFVGETGRKIDELVERVEGRYDKRYHVFIGGHAKKIKDKYWEAYTYYKGMYRESTMSTLRHEFTHELFHNWGLQGIVLSRLKSDKEGMVKKKKEILETEDYKEKARLIRRMWTLRSREELPDIQAANSWLAEGTATYCETYPLGSQNNRWLYLYQEMTKKGSIYPLESLTYSRMGSFPGVCPDAQLYLYAQSWALVTFLMERYPKEFMEYQKRMADETAQGQEDIDWLMEAVGKDIRAVEEEFTEYMDTYEEIDDPDISQLIKLRSIFRD